MKKKAVHKKSVKSTPSYYRYLVIAFIILVLVLTAKVAYQGLKSSGVLGTSSFDSQDAGNQDSNSQDQQNQTPEPQANIGQSRTPEPKEIQSPEPREIQTPEPREIKPRSDSVPEKVEIQVENHKSQINAAAEGTQVEIKTEDNGSLSFKAKKADGTEVQLETHALDNINEALKENDVEIGTTSARGFSITNKETQAETQFPISVDLANKVLSVSTPNGQKDLTVLPDQAVQNLLNQKIIDRVAQTATSTSGAQLQLVQLRLFANNPVFQVQGVDDKKLFGLVPVGVQKTTLVSAQTGQVVNTNMDLVNTILNLFSFQ